MVARGEQGRVWRLVTDRGSYAVKERIHPLVAAPLRFGQLEAVLDQATTVH
jgi:hypothetical protein